MAGSVPSHSKVAFSDILSIMDLTGKIQMKFPGVNMVVKAASIAYLGKEVLVMS